MKTRAEDWEIPAWEICDFIAAVNRLKASRRVFNEEGALDAIELGNANLFAFVKWSRDRSERALIVINKDRWNIQTFSTQRAGQFMTGVRHVEDLSPDSKLEYSQDYRACSLKPSGIHVLWAA